MTQAGKMRLATLILVPIGLAMIIASIWTGISAKGFVDDAVKADGVVIRLERRESGTGSDRSITYAPVFTFSDAKEQEHTIVSSSSSSPVAYEVNEKVEVLYLADEPSEAKLNSFFSLWGLPVILGVIGVMQFFMAGVFFIISLRKG